ncbi:MAG TPA: hypothetical protein VI757_04970 [Bacteroidia bacterium]|nr:hypothetical protein [Bacteroidia bacterium]
MDSENIEMVYSWKYTDAWPYNWMVNDLWRGVQAEQNYLVALGLFTYSEVLGRMILRTVGISGDGPKAFRKFTEEYVGYKFADDREWKNVFDIYRNGLAHEFFIKSMGGKVYNEDGTAPCGITISGTFFELRIHSYFIHFTKGLEKAIDEKVLELRPSPR